MIFSILSYFTISKNYFINYIIPFYNTPNIPKLYFFFILFKYSFLILFLLFLFFFSFPLFLPQPLANPYPAKSQQKITQIKQAPKIHLPPQQNHNKSKIHSKSLASLQSKSKSKIKIKIQNP